MPTYPDRNVVFVRREPRIEILEYADIEHRVLSRRERQWLTMKMTTTTTMTKGLSKHHSQHHQCRRRRHHHHHRQ
jgi:hypothetical protein